jgi:hypothetical protein
MNWLLLVYKIPREPTAGRVYVWRKLKQLGAITLQDAAWALPANPKTQEHFQWLAAEIIEMGGEVALFKADLLLGHEPQALRERFEAPIRAAYVEILKGLKRRKPDLDALAKRYQQVKAQDHLNCALGDEVRARLLAAQGDDV